MALYDRLIGQNDLGQPVAEKISVHAFNAVLGERARGGLATDAAARTAVNSFINPALSVGEETEPLTLLATIAGSAIAKLARAKEIEDVLVLGEHQATGYTTPTLVKVRLGV